MCSCTSLATELSIRQAYTTEKLVETVSAATQECDARQEGSILNILGLRGLELVTLAAVEAFELELVDEVAVPVPELDVVAAQYLIAIHPHFLLAVTLPCSVLIRCQPHYLTEAALI